MDSIKEILKYKRYALITAIPISLLAFVGSILNLSLDKLDDAQRYLGYSQVTSPSKPFITPIHRH